MEFEVTGADFNLPNYLETKKVATFEEAKKVRADFIAQGIPILSIQIVQVTRETIEDEEYTNAFNAFHAEVMDIVKEQRANRKPAGTTCPDCSPQSPCDRHFAQMEQETEDAYHATLANIEAEPDRYPTLAERLAESMKDDKRP